MIILKAISKFFYYIYLGLIAPYIFLKKYIDNNIKNVNAYKYWAICNDKKEVGYVLISEDLIENFLLTENKKLLKYKTNILLKFRFRNINKLQIDDKYLIYILNHLTTYLNYGNNLIASFSILINSLEDKKINIILRNIRYYLMCGYSLKDSLEKQGSSFPKHLISAVNNDNEIYLLNEIRDYYSELDYINRKIKKVSFFRLFIFPYVLLIFTFLFDFVVTQLYNLYDSLFDYIPSIIVKLNNLCNNYSGIFNIVLLLDLIIIIIILMLIFFAFNFYNKSKFFKIKKLYINQQLYIYSKTLSSVIKYQIFNSDDIGIVTFSHDYQNIIEESINYYNKEKVLSPIIKGNKLISKKIYEMVISGEKFDSLLLQFNNLSNYYYKIIDEYQEKRLKRLSLLLVVSSLLLFCSLFLILLFQFLIVLK